MCPENFWGECYQKLFAPNPPELVEWCGSFFCCLIIHQPYSLLTSPGIGMVFWFPLKKVRRGLMVFLCSENVQNQNKKRIQNKKYLCINRLLIFGFQSLIIEGSGFGLLHLKQCEAMYIRDRLRVVAFHINYFSQLFKFNSFTQRKWSNNLY